MEQDSKEDKLIIGEESTHIENIENVSAEDVLRHFYANIFPGIKKQFFGVPATLNKAKKNIWSIFSKQSKNMVTSEPINNTGLSEKDTNKLFGIAIAKGIFDLVIGDDVQNLKRINLFLEVAYLEMTRTAYFNTRLEFNNCAEVFESTGDTNKAKIIKESLNLCDKRLKKEITILTFTEDSVIAENGYGKTIQSKEDFLSNNTSSTK